MDDLIKKFSDKAPEIVKENKGALIGALVGYVISNDEKAKSVLMGTVAGSLLGDRNGKE